MICIIQWLSWGISRWQLIFNDFCFVALLSSGPGGFKRYRSYIILLLLYCKNKSIRPYLSPSVGRARRWVGGRSKRRRDALHRCRKFRVRADVVEHRLVGIADHLLGDPAQGLVHRAHLVSKHSCHRQGMGKHKLLCYIYEAYGVYRKDTLWTNARLPVQIKVLLARVFPVLWRHQTYKCLENVQELPPT